MAKTLIHLTHGPEQPSQAAWAFQVARAASQQGHAVTLFLAGDAAYFAANAQQPVSLDGPVMRALCRSYEAVLSAGARVYICDPAGASLAEAPAVALARGADLAKPHTFAKLAAEHDQVFSY
jgi:predicted peroxiredoxin